MSKNLEGIVAEIRRVRSQKRPEIEKKKQRLDALLATVQATRSKATAVAAHYPDLTTAMQGVPFNEAENKLIEAQAACETALTRLRRESINIGVAGKARQGKSMILQMLTGLGDKQIPTGDGGFCTASRSIVHNHDDKSATIHYLTESELLIQKVYPSYAPKGSSDVALGLPNRPASIAAFIKAPLPSVPETESEEALINWSKVCTLQADLRENPALVAKLGAAPESVPLDTVRDFLVKDNGETNYQVVDYVEIVTRFDTDLPKNMTVYDLPGLEDPSPGIRETMLKCVSEDADIVFLLRMPKNTGDDWDKADLRTMTELKQIYPNGEVLPKDWIQLVLNLDKRPESHNEKNVAKMAKTAPRRFTPVICDCGSKDAVREMVDANIDALVNQAGRIDDLRIRDAETAFRAALTEVGSLYNALRNASGDIVAQESGFVFKPHWEEFQKWLRFPFRSQMAKKTNDSLYPFSELANEVLAKHFKAARAKFKALYDANENAAQFPAELPVFSKARIENLMGGNDAENGINKAVRNQREAVLKFVRAELTGCCEELMNRYFEKVVSIGFDGNPALKHFGNEKAASRERISDFLCAVRQSGSFPTIESAAEELQSFSLTFEDTILPAIYSTDDLDDFDPDLSYAGSKTESDDEDGDDKKADVRRLDRVKQHILREIPVSDAQGRAKYLFNWLKLKSGSLVSSMTTGSDESAAGAIAKYVAAAMKANYDAFVFRFIWGDDCDTEWETLARKNQAIFWKEDFEVATANSKLAKDWNAALAGLATAL